MTARRARPNASAGNGHEVGATSVVRLKVPNPDDEHATFESCLSNVRRLLVRNLRRIGVPPAEAEDIAQNVLPKLRRCRATEDLGRAAYATEIAKRMWFRSNEQARRAEVGVRDWRVHDSLIPAAPEGRLDARELLFQWERFAATLPANVSAATEMCCIEGATYAEVAAMFEVPVSTIHGWLQSARAGFREWLRTRHAFEKGRKLANGKGRRPR